MASLTAMMATLTTVSGVVVRYFVKSEVRNEINKLRLELAKERAERIETRAAAVLSAIESR